MKKYVLTKDGVGDFRLTTRENHEAAVTDERKCWDFKKSAGFVTLEMVLVYIERYFKIGREEIEVIQ